MNRKEMIMKKCNDCKSAIILLNMMGIVNEMAERETNLCIKKFNHTLLHTFETCGYEYANDNIDRFISRKFAALYHFEDFVGSPIDNPRLHKYIADLQCLSN